MKRSSGWAAAALLASAAAVPARAAVYLVRHAEQGEMADMKADPALTDAGRKRAKDLARALASVSLKDIYVTEFRRTRETADPVAKTKGLKPVQEVSTKTDDLAALLKARPRTDDVLVVAHRDTLPGLLKTLGVADPPAIGAADYDDLFIVVFPPDGSAASMHRLHYGDPSAPLAPPPAAKP